MFNTAPYDIQEKIHVRWEDFSSSLEIAISVLESPPSILQAAIIAKAPQHIIVDIIDRFDCIFVRDSFDRYPINVAVEEGLESGVIQQIIQKMSIEQNCPTIHVASQHGLQWSEYMKELVESNTEEVVYGFDNTTGLRLYMLAAMGNYSDLSTIYGMMRMNP